MLTLSKQTDYALLALAALVRRERQAAKRGADLPLALPAKEVAELHNVPVEFMAKVLQRLAKAHVVTSTFGPTGGYTLSRPATEITVGEIIDLIDGGIALAHCMRVDGENDCQQSVGCSIRGPLTRVNEEIARVLTRMTLDEITESEPEPQLVQIGIGSRPKQSVLT
jgi:Rrf2 family protein